MQKELNKLKNGAIIAGRFPSDRPFVGGETTDLNGATILEY